MKAPNHSANDARYTTPIPRDQLLAQYNIDPTIVQIFDLGAEPEELLQAWIDDDGRAWTVSQHLTAARSFKAQETATRRKHVAAIESASTRAGLSGLASWSGSISGGGNLVFGNLENRLIGTLGRHADACRTLARLHRALASALVLSGGA